MKRVFAFLARHFELGEILLMIGMLLLYGGVSALFGQAWAQVACGSILIVIGFITGREGN